MCWSEWSFSLSYRLRQFLADIDNGKNRIRTKDDGPDYSEDIDYHLFYPLSKSSEPNLESNKKKITQQSAFVERNKKPLFVRSEHSGIDQENDDECTEDNLSEKADLPLSDIGTSLILLLFFSCSTEYESLAWD